MKKEEMRLLVENYSDNLAKIEDLKRQLNQRRNNTKITATYGLNAGGSSGEFSSKVEDKAIEQITQERLLKDHQKQVDIVIVAEKILTNAEREVIEYFKLGVTNKLSDIARLVKKKKKYVFDTRNRAIKKMCEFYDAQLKIGGYK